MLHSEIQNKLLLCAYVHTLEMLVVRLHEYKHVNYT